MHRRLCRAFTVPAPALSRAPSIGAAAFTARVAAVATGAAVAARAAATFARTTFAPATAYDATRLASRYAGGWLP